MEERDDSNLNDDDDNDLLIGVRLKRDRDDGKGVPLALLNVANRLPEAVPSERAWKF